MDVLAGLKTRDSSRAGLSPLARTAKLKTSGIATWMTRKTSATLPENSILTRFGRWLRTLFRLFYIRCSARSTSSTSLYHCFLVPTLALSFHPTDFGSFPIKSSSSSMRPATTSRSLEVNAS